MAKTTNFTFSNTTAVADQSSTGISVKQLSLLTDYAASGNDSKRILVNHTTPLDADERFEIKFENVSKVPANVKVMHPAPNPEGVRYTVRVDEILRTTFDDGTIVDEPIIGSMTITHPLSSNIDDTIIIAVINRLLSALYTNSGKSRLEEMMRGQTTPKAD